MYIDDIKLFARNEKELETIIQATRIYSQETGMEFGIEKGAMLIMRCGKRHMTEGIELLNKKRSKCPDKRNLTNTGEYWKRTPSNKWI